MKMRQRRKHQHLVNRVFMLIMKRHRQVYWRDSKYGRVILEEATRHFAEVDEMLADLDRKLAAQE